ncbi:MAG: MFS transporter [Proteobacteria bacterium]|nr:MAG: MFS transporter [Pseudomonadota bacterium]
MLPITNKERFAYFCYGTGQCISFGLAGSFTLIFYTDVFGITATVASLIFLFARAWDAVVDPLIASLMDTVSSKEGKFRIYLKYMPLIIAITTVLCFIKIDTSNSVKNVYAIITYILWGTTYAISDVPFWSMSAVMTNDPQERSRLVSYAGLAVSVGVAIPLLVFPLLLDLTVAGSFNYAISSAILMFAAFFLMNFGYRHTRERVVNHSEKITIRQVFSTVGQNKPLFIVLLAFFTNLFSNVASSLAAYFFTYNMHQPSLLSVYGMLNILCASGLLAVPFLLQKITKKQLLIWLCVSDVILRLIFFFVIGYHNQILFFIFITITGVVGAVSWPIMSAMIGDTIDYTARITGNRCEAIMFAGQTFTGKMAIAVSGGLLGLILVVIKYVPNQQQSSYALQGLFFGLVLLPAVGSILKIIILRFYNEHKVLAK